MYKCLCKVGLMCKRARVWVRISLLVGNRVRLTKLMSCVYLHVYMQSLQIPTHYRPMSMESPTIVALNLKELHQQSVFFRRFHDQCNFICVRYSQHLRDKYSFNFATANRCTFYREGYNM